MQGGKRAGALPAGEPTEEVKEQQKEVGDNEAQVEHESDCYLTGRTGSDRDRLNKISEQSRQRRAQQVKWKRVLRVADLN